MARATILDKNEVQTIIKKFLDEFQNCVNQQKNPNQAEFDKVIGNNFHIKSNGSDVANNLTEYLSRVEQFQKRYSHCNIHFFSEDTVCADNHFACNYKVELTLKNGQKILVLMMAIGACEHDKITLWKQVAHEKGTGQWEV